jgi:hypothetical protein
VNTSGATITSGGRRSNNCLALSNVQGAGSNVLKSFDSQATWVVGAAFKYAGFTGSSNGQIIALYDSGTLQVDIRITPSGAIQATRNGTQLGISAAVITTGTYYYVEFKALIHASAGTIDVQVNGASVLSLTGQNTKNSANATANMVFLGPIAQGGGGNGTLLIADLYILDGQTGASTFLGDQRVDCYMPTGNGSNSQFTNNSGNSTNNYSHVNEALQDGDTSYVADAVVNDIDSYAITGLTHTPLTITGVQVNLVIRKDDAGIKQVAPIVYRSATAYVGNTLTLSTSYLDLTQQYEKDPATSAAWTKTNINASEFGLKVIT